MLVSRLEISNDTTTIQHISLQVNFVIYYNIIYYNIYHYLLSIINIYYKNIYYKYIKISIVNI